MTTLSCDLRRSVDLVVAMPLFLAPRALGRTRAELAETQGPPQPSHWAQILHSHLDQVHSTPFCFPTHSFMHAHDVPCIEKDPFCLVMINI
jgi:hypothetical protein